MQPETSPSTVLQRNPVPMLVALHQGLLTVIAMEISVREIK